MHPRIFRLIVLPHFPSHYISSTFQIHSMPYSQLRETAETLKYAGLKPCQVVAKQFPAHIPTQTVDVSLCLYTPTSSFHFHTCLSTKAFRPARAQPPSTPRETMYFKTTLSSRLVCLFLRPRFQESRISHFLLVHFIYFPIGSMAYSQSTKIVYSLEYAGLK